MRLCDDIYTTCFRVHVLLEHVNSETGAVCRRRNANTRTRSDTTNGKGEVQRKMNV
jgi:hypothetical protein